MADTTASGSPDGTNDIVAAQATKRNEIPLEQVNLIGIMGKPGDMTALFRTGQGAIRTVKEGDHTEIGRIFEIDVAGVVVTRANGNSIFIPPIPVG